MLKSSFIQKVRAVLFQSRVRGDVRRRQAMKSEQLETRALLSAGTLDTTFDTDGIVTTPMSPLYDEAYTVAVQADGKTVAAGVVYTPDGTEFGIARYNVDGTLDTSFDVDGKVSVQINQFSCIPFTVAMQADGKIVVAGFTYNGSNIDTAMVRLLPDGSLDTSFGTGGKVTTAVGSGDDNANKVIIQPDGKILLGGEAMIGGQRDLAILRYEANGSLDTTFGTGGIFTRGLFGSTPDALKGLALQPDGKIVASGYITNSGSIWPSLLRLNTNGTLDGTLNGDGFTAHSFGSTAVYSQNVSVLSDGDILVGGVAFSGGRNNFSAIRYNDNGSLDSSFDGDGLLLSAIRPYADSASQIFVRPDGKFYLGGNSYSGTDQDFALARYNPNGTLDTTFGTNGVTTTSIGSGDDIASAMAVGPDGRIVLAGGTYSGGSSDFAVARYLGSNLPTSLLISSTQVVEGSPAAMTVGTFSTLDPDAGETFTYSLVSGAGSTDNASFVIDGNVLKTNAIFDSTVKSSYSIRVRTTDNNGLWLEKTIALTVREGLRVYSTSISDDGTLQAGRNRIHLTFSVPMQNADVAANYGLQRAGSDGLLTTSDFVEIPTSVIVSGQAVTLTFASMVEDTYRLIVRDEILDSNGLALDGDADRLVGGDYSTDFVVDAGAPVIDLVSESLFPSYRGANNSSSGTSISSDGRFVAFQSSASNLIAGDLNGTDDVFVMDLQTGTTSLVSSGASGQGNNYSFRPSISGDGRFVAFQSNASNLVMDDTNETSDIFVRDLQTGTTSLVSTGANGHGNGSSIEPSISSDGRFISFSSTASNLVTDDTNGYADVFVKDLQTGTITLISTGASGQGNHDSRDPSISSDGRFVAFSSPASNLVAGDTIDLFSSNDVFVKDLQTGTISLVSVATNGQGNTRSNSPSISGDGRFVAFISDANSVVTGDNNGYQDVFVRDLQTGTTTLVSTGANGQGNSYSYQPSISSDGRFVAFHSYASNLVTGDNNGYQDVFARDLQTGTTTLVSTGASGQGNGYSEQPAISSDGRFVAFHSYASNLDGRSTGVVLGVFVKDLSTSSLALATPGDPRVITTSANSRSFGPSVSSDGRFVAFYSHASNLVTGDTNGTTADVFVKDLQTGTITLVSTGVSGQANNGSYEPSISSDGRFVAFRSDASNLVSRDANGNPDVFVRQNPMLGAPAFPLSLKSSDSTAFVVDRFGFGTGQLLPGTTGAFDGLNRLQIDGTEFSVPANSSASTQDGDQTIVSASSTFAGLSARREVTVPSTGGQSFARTVDVFTNSTGSTITVPVRLFGNLGSDAATTVFMTSDGDTIVEPTDLWFGTDDGDGTGTPAIIHLLHAGSGLQPFSVNVIEDNVEWSYSLTVPAGETKRLAHFTVLGSTRAAAIAAVNALVTESGFAGEAAAFLDAGELGSIVNFQFDIAPVDVVLSPSAVAENLPAGAVVGKLSSVDPGDTSGFTYTLVSGDGDTDNTSFTISSGSLLTAASFDREAKPVRSVRIRTTDQAGFWFEKILTVQITNVNETPTALSLSNSRVSSDALPGTAIGLFTTTDPDSGNSFTWTLASGPGDTDNATFQINGNVLLTRSAFDFDTQSTFSIRVQTADQNGLTFANTFTVTLVKGVATVVENLVPGGGVNDTNESSDPMGMIDVSGTIYFVADDGLNGRELWRISNSGIAEMVEDAVPGGGINAGSDSSYPQFLTNVNGTLYFRATDALNGLELWRINSAGVAEIVEDSVFGSGINVGGDSSFPDDLTIVNGTLYFSAIDNVNGQELWRINSAGVAEMVEDALPGGGINSGSNHSSPGTLLNVNGTLYFQATDGVNGFELWRISSAGVAEMVENAVPGGGIHSGSNSSNPRSLSNVNGTLYFRANDGVNGYELWRIGSTGVAEIVEDAVPGGGTNPGGNSSDPEFLTNVNGTLYFRATDGVNGYELWRINNSGVAEMVEDAVAGGGINSGNNHSIPRFLTNVNGTLYFRATDGLNGYELWRINSSGVAEMVEDALAGGGINPGSNGSGASYLTNVNGTLYFRATDGLNGYEVWRINSSGVADLVEDAVAGSGISPWINSSPRILTNVNGTLYFNIRDTANGYELWRINSSGVAEMVEDAVAGGGINSGSSHSHPQTLTNVNGMLYFRGNDNLNGGELWRINSSGVAEMVDDAIPGGGINPGEESSNPSQLTNVNGTLYFSANDGTNGEELWRINSSGVAEVVENAIPGGGISPGSSDSQPNYLTNVNGTLYFNASDGVNGHELWRVNSLGVAEIVEDPVVGGGISAGSSSSFPRDLTNFNGTLYFRAADPATGYELWRVNSLGVAEIVEDSIPGGGISPGSSGSYPSALTNVNGTAYFVAIDQENGIELWRINSLGEAELIEDLIPGGGINPGSNGSYPGDLANVNGTLYFNASDGVNGSELWRINSLGGAELVEDAVAGGGIVPGSNSSSASYMTNANGTLYFRAHDGVNGSELWRVNSSGVAELVEDAVAGGGIASGSSSSNPKSLTNVGGTLYFFADDGVNGDELWRINSSGLAEMVENAISGGGLVAGAGSSDPGFLTNVNGTLYFVALDDLSRKSLWRLNEDGIAGIVEEISSGAGLFSGVTDYNSPQLTIVNSKLYFVADDGFLNGRELWVLSVNAAPTNLTLSSTTIAENQPAGMTVGVFTTTDPDADVDFSYALVAGDGDTDNGVFTISGNQLRANIAFDFETRNAYSVRVRTTDSGGLSFERVFSISVTDLPEDVTAPVTLITALPAASNTQNLNITVTGNDPGAGASGVKEYDLYYSTGGAFIKFATVPVGSPSTTFTGNANTNYWFRSLGRDNAGNVETKTTSDTYTRIGDVVPPSSQVTSAVPTSAGLFTVAMSGTKLSGSAMTVFDVYVAIDGNAPMLIGSAAAVATGGGSFTGQMLFQGLPDGTSHTYRFFSVARDGSGNIEAMPAATSDISVTVAFSAAGLTATGIDVQNGVNQRSYVRYLDVLFSTNSGVSNLLNPGRVKVEQFTIDATSVVPGTGTLVTGAGLTQTGNRLRLDFGATGLGGLRQAGNGFYRILLDMDGNGSFADAGDSAFEFHRLFGDANGDAKVDVADTNLVTSQIGRTGTNLDGDLDGNGSVNSTDRLYTTQQRGKKLLDPLLGWLDD
ncbi:MAG: hypothetical protein U0936_01720 [Planctomycetaceae bacterium]